jgi:uncharacterized protein YjbI with pentapeptide repeats
LHYANLGEVNFESASLRNAVMYDSDLSGANLTDANLKSASLQNVKFRHARIENTNFSGANLREADFRRALIRGPIFKNAKLGNLIIFAEDFAGIDISSSKEAANLRIEKQPHSPNLV